MRYFEFRQTLRTTEPPLGSRGTLSAGFKVSRAWTDRSLPSSAELKNGGAVPPPPPLGPSSWRSCLLMKHKDIFPLYFRWHVLNRAEEYSICQHGGSWYCICCWYSWHFIWGERPSCRTSAVGQACNPRSCNTFLLQRPPRFLPGRSTLQMSPTCQVRTTHDSVIIQIPSAVS
jgi:hypothetical protein